MTDNCNTDFLSNDYDILSHTDSEVCYIMHSICNKHTREIRFTLQARTTYSCMAGGQCHDRGLGLRPRLYADCLICDDSTAKVTHATIVALYKWTLFYCFEAMFARLLYQCHQLLQQSKMWFQLLPNKCEHFALNHEATDSCFLHAHCMLARYHI